MKVKKKNLYFVKKWFKEEIALALASFKIDDKI